MITESQSLLSDFENDIINLFSEWPIVLHNCCNGITINLLSSNGQKKLKSLIWCYIAKMVGILNCTPTNMVALCNHDIISRSYK